jgi:hypothetical protein
LPSSIGSSLQSHREALMQTGLISTPWSRASRTICAGAYRNGYSALSPKPSYQ